MAARSLRVVAPALHGFLKRYLAVAITLHEYVSQIALCGCDGLLEDSGSTIGDDRKDSDVECNVDEDKDEATTPEFQNKVNAEFHPRTYLDRVETFPTGVLKIIDKQVARNRSGVRKEDIKLTDVKNLEGQSEVRSSLPVKSLSPVPTCFN
ncbi:hypothetical protein ABG067_006246 [Albugo candida]